MNVWNFILKNLQNDIATTLLFVVESIGSSPGRKGFIMAVNEQGVFEGTIGGGIMEVKMIELAKSKLQDGDNTAIIKKQYHDKRHPRNQSGLICSGNQTVLILPLNTQNIEKITEIIKRNRLIYLILNRETGFQISFNEKKEQLNIRTENDFDVILIINLPKRIHIFGAGHVGLALARQMFILNYKIIQYDDRPKLYTLKKNKYAQEIKIIDYQNIEKEMDAHPTDMVVIASYSYRSDKIILQQLYDKPFAYIGMMGSDHKIVTLKKELKKEGISKEALNHIFAPIGLNMYSKTAEEIALSIASQIILEANKNLPTGRNYHL